MYIYIHISIYLYIYIYKPARLSVAAATRRALEKAALAPGQVLSSLSPPSPKSKEMKVKPGLTLIVTAGTDIAV